MANSDEIVTISDPVTIVPVGRDVTVVRIDDEATGRAGVRGVATGTPPISSSPASVTVRPRRGGGDGPVVTAAVWIIFALHRLWMKLPPDTARRARHEGHASHAPLEGPSERTEPPPDRPRKTPASAATADEDSPA